MDIWACNCPLCRALVHPILKLLVIGQEANNKQRHTKQQITTIGKGEGERLSDTEQLEGISVTERSQLGEGGIKGGKQENVEESNGGSKQQNKDVSNQTMYSLQVQTIQDTAATPQPQEKLEQKEVKTVIPEEVKERIEKLENELGKLRSELKEVLESISEALIDVRAAVVENINPFLSTNGSKQMLDTLNVGVSVEHVVELIKVLNDELAKFNPNALVELIDCLAESGSISERDARMLKALVKIVSEMKRKGITVDEQIRLITLLLGKRSRTIKVD